MEEPIVEDVDLDLPASSGTDDNNETNDTNPSLILEQEIDSEKEPPLLLLVGESTSAPTSSSRTNTTTTPATTPTTTFLERQARRVARWPKTHFWVPLLLTLVVSALGMYYGDFYVNVNTTGWPSRGTLISKRHSQTLLVRRNRKALSQSNNTAIWHELTSVIQPNWETVQTATPREEKTNNQTNQTTIQLYNNDTDDFVRKNLTTLLETCNVELYLQPRFVERSKLWPVWRITNNNNDISTTASSALDPDILEELCLAEENTQHVLRQRQLCTGCSDGDCLPPFSIVLYARFVVASGFSMNCSTLAAAWAPYQANVEEEWKECIGHLRRSVGTLDYNRGPCPATFSPTFVDEDFDQTGRVIYTSSIFVTEAENTRELYDLSRDYDRGGTRLQGAYDTQYQHFTEYFALKVVYQDSYLAAGSALVTTMAMLLHTRSIFLTLVGILQIALSFPLAFCFYRFVLQITFFPFLNMIGLFVIFALGADNVFVAVDKWKNRRNAYPEDSTEDIAGKALPSAGRAMILTTTTTAVAFLSSALCPVAPIKLFAIFCGLLVIFDYILDVVVMFPCLCIYDSYRFERNYWVAFRTPPGIISSKNSDNHHHREEPENVPDEQQQQGAGYVEEEKVDESNIEVNQSFETDKYNKSAVPSKKCVTDCSGDNMDRELDLNSNNMIRRILHGYYKFLHRWRWVLMAICIAALCVCSYFATTLKVPETADEIQLLEDDVEYEKNRRWRTNLLADSLATKLGGGGHVSWGLVPADTGNHNNPDSWTTLVLDESFDPSTTAAQLYLKDFCESLFAEDFAEKPSLDYKCSINRFEEWLENQVVLPNEFQNSTYTEHCYGASGLPMAETSFHSCLAEWARQEEDTEILSRNNIVKIIQFPFWSRVRFDSPINELGNDWHLMEALMTQQNHLAPVEVSNAFFSSFDWWWWDTMQNVYQSAVSSGIIAVAVSALVIMISSRSLSITFFCALSVLYVLVSVASLLSAAKWTLGFLESICFTILIGLSADFVIHLGHAYAELPGNTDRHIRTQYALIHLGPSILAAGFTTIAGAAIMLFTTINFLRLFAFVLFFTIVQATIGSFLVLLVLTDCVGPSNPTYATDYLISKLYTTTFGWRRQRADG